MQLLPSPLLVFQTPRGKQVLAEAKANGPSERIEGGAAFVGDLLTTVYYEGKDGNLRCRCLFADGF